MTLHENLKSELKDAMKAKDAVRLRTIRSILGAATNELVASGRTPQDWLTDEETISLIKRLRKQRAESITQYEAAGRDELAAPEREEAAILDGYLPTMMTAEQILPIVQAKQTELGITDKTKMGVLIGAVMKETAGQADGGDVKNVVASLFEEE
jgi:uncharacterized protein YqeY